MLRAKSKQQVLSTAAQLFYSRGVNSTGVEALVREAQISKPTLYAHFGSKAELVAATLLQVHAERAEALRGRARRAIDPLDRPLATFTWLAESFSWQGARGCPFLNAAAELTDVDHPARKVIGDEKRSLIDLFVDLLHGAGYVDAERLASQLLILLDGLAGRVLIYGAEAASAAAEDAIAAAATLLATQPNHRSRVGERALAQSEPFNPAASHALWSAQSS